MVFWQRRNTVKAAWYRSNNDRKLCLKRMTVKASSSHGYTWNTSFLGVKERKTFDDWNRTRVLHLRSDSLVARTSASCSSIIRSWSTSITHCNAVLSLGGISRFNKKISWPSGIGTSLLPMVASSEDLPKNLGGYIARVVIYTAKIAYRIIANTLLLPLWNNKEVPVVQRKRGPELSSSSFNLKSLSEGGSQALLSPQNI